MSEPALQYLVDTSWAIRYLRGRKAYIERLVALGVEHLAVSVISVAELYEGVSLASDPARCGEARRLSLVGEDASRR